MKILYIHQYFKTPEEGGAIRSWYISNAMIERGHQVEMITSHNKPNYEKVNFNGINVHYLPVMYKNNFGFFRRLISFLIFAHKAYYLGLKVADVDMAYITSTPLTVGLTALKLNSKKGIPYVFEVRDLWPEAPIQIGLIKNRWIKSITRKLEKKIYKKANKVIALSPGIKDYISRIVQEEKIHFCPNMSDCDFFSQSIKRNVAIEEKLGLKGQFVIGYFGAIGRINALHYLLDLAKKTLESGLKVRYLIIGQGAMIENLKQKSKKEGLSNVIFIEHMGKDQLLQYLTVIDAAYISFANYPILENNSPNKFFDALAGGKCIISNMGGWIAELIEQHKCGIYTKPERDANILYKLEKLVNSPEDLKFNQQNARKLAETKFEKKKLTKELMEFIESD